MPKKFLDRLREFVSRPNDASPRVVRAVIDPYNGSYTTVLIKSGTRAECEAYVRERDQAGETGFRVLY